jgi:hypothetical protein
LVVARVINLKEFEGYLGVDKYQLDDELVRHPELLHKVSDAVAEANAKRDQMKESLQTADAELDKDVREALEADEVKATEPMVKNLVQTDKKHKQAFDAWLAAKLAADKLAALKESFITRGFSIAHLCELYSENYYTQNSIRGDANTDRVHYERKRAQLAEARERR